MRGTQHLFYGRGGSAPFFKGGRIVRDRRKVELRSGKTFIAADAKRMKGSKTRQMKQSIIVFPKYGEKVVAIRVGGQKGIVIALNHEGRTLKFQQMAPSFQNKGFVTFAIDFD